MTTPRTIDHAVKVLFRAITATAQGDRLGVVDARSELLALAVAAQDFEQRLVTAAVDQLVAWTPSRMQHATKSSAPSRSNPAATFAIRSA